MIRLILKKLYWGFFRHILSDRQNAIYRYWLEFNRFPDLDNPTRLTEKIQHLKLHDRTDLRRTAADRVKVREYVSRKIGEDHLIPLIGNFESLTPSVWDSLPPSFVLKANHGCNMVEIVEDKSNHSYEEIRNITRDWQETDYYKVGREWVYKDLPRTIVVEKLLQNSEGLIPEDFKFFCFHGRTELIQIDFDRFGDHSRNIYSRDFKLLPVKIIYDQNSQPVKKHPLMDEAVHLADTLSTDFNFVRVDLFLLDEKIYFGELTNYPGNGFVPFQPDAFDLEIGDRLKL